MTYEGSVHEYICTLQITYKMTVVTFDDAMDAALTLAAYMRPRMKQIYGMSDSDLAHSACNNGMCVLMHVPCFM
jgi:hypothetical protein